MKYIVLSKRLNNITKPLNTDFINIKVFDGTSSAKCIDKKELFMIKTCMEGNPTFNVMSLEQPKECDTPGIKEAMQNSISKMNFTFLCKKKRAWNAQ